MSKQSPRVAIYARVSSDHQAEAGTIASQVEEILGRASKDGFEVPADLRFLDDGYSGSTTARPALERLRDVASTGGIDVLYVHCPDRLARSFVIQAVLLDELQGLGVEVRFFNRRFGEGPEEQLMLQFQGAIAEYERAKILERSRRGKLHAARRGSVNVLTAAPYGYEYVRCPESREAELRISAHRAGIVRDIFEWFATERVPITQICARLVAAGLPSPGGCKGWHRSTVSSILRNPAYRGLAAYGKTRLEPRKTPLRARRGAGDFPKKPYSTRRVAPEEWIHIAVPAIVCDELWKQAQEQLKANRRVAQRHGQGSTYLLQGLVACKRCGYALTGRKTASTGGRTYTYYRCLGSEPSRFGGERLCGRNATRCDLLDVAVWEDVRELLEDPSRIREEYERRLQPRDAQDASDVPSSDRVVRSLERARHRLIDAFQDGLIDKEELVERSEAIQRRLTAMKDDLERARHDEKARAELRLVMTRIEDFTAKLRHGLEEATWATRRELIRALVKRIEVDDDGIRIVYRVAPPPAGARPSRGDLQPRTTGADRDPEAVPDPSAASAPARRGSRPPTP